MLTLSLFNLLCLSAEVEDDAGYLDVAVSEVKHPPPQLSPMPEGLTSHQVHIKVFAHSESYSCSVLPLFLPSLLSS